ncbi:MAG: NAD(P)/FAD-dependent oxidoreductase [Proteobacteria bacterium]|nr:NAD(P)/FAD-dependent oxidoreductase [Pseudomonadota bacterium]
MKKTKERLVIVGGGMAGAACVDSVLSLSPDRYEVTLLSAETHVNYNRVLLAQVLREEKGVGDISLTAPEWYEENGVTLQKGCKVDKIDRHRRTVIDAEGREFPYDRLVLATGSRGLVPPIPGAGLYGVVCFRNLADSERISSILDKCTEKKKAVVIGGGLLGLEVAYSLNTLGVEVTVVHLEERLMERQVDSVAAGLLTKDLKELGVEVRLGCKTTEITGTEHVEGVLFSDGTSIETDLVVMSIGIRPNKELAESAGIYCEKGIVVSDVMQTYDSAIYAVGECVQHRGRTFGLVASVFEQARVVANHLAGDSRLYFTDRPSSTRLKVPGVNIYSAGEVVAGPGAETIEYLDRGAGLYKKVVLKDGKVKGVLLYGDVIDGPELFGLLVEETDITARRSRLLFGVGAGAEGAGVLSVKDLPDSTIVCGCNGVTKGAIVEAIEKKGLFTREEVAAETKASTSCGGCSGLVDRILESVLGAGFDASYTRTGICACTQYSRDEIVQKIRELKLISVEEVMEALGWESVGCEACRPALNYYVNMVNPDTAIDDRSSRLINERAHANIQTDGRFSVVPQVIGGVITPDELKRIANAAVKYDVDMVKITGGTRIGLYGIERSDLAKVWGEIGMRSGHAYAKSVRTVKSCVGERFCRYGTQDSVGLGVELETMLGGLATPAKVKLGVDGCPRNCAESAVKDIGITGVAGSWEIYVGGGAGIELTAGERLATAESKSEVIEIVGAFLQKYREEAEYGERTAKWVRRVGVELLRESIVEDREHRKELAERLAMAIKGMVDPWKEAQKIKETA